MTNRNGWAMSFFNLFVYVYWRGGVADLLPKCHTGPHRLRLLVVPLVVFDFMLSLAPLSSDALTVCYEFQHAVDQVGTAEGGGSLGS